MTKRIDFEIKEKMVSLFGACFWYWNSFYSFLESCGVSRSVQKRFPKDNKYQVMRHILAHLEERGDIATIENIIAGFYRLTNVVDKGVLDEAKAKTLLAEFKTAVGNDPVESEVRRREKARRAQEAQERIREQRIFKTGSKT